MLRGAKHCGEICGPAASQVLQALALRFAMLVLAEAVLADTMAIGQSLFFRQACALEEVAIVTDTVAVPNERYR